MNPLRLPIIHERFSRGRALSMDEYLKFVQLNLKYTLDKKAYAKWKKILAVNVPFLVK